MKTFLAMMFLALPAYGADLLTLSTDKASYAVGEPVIVHASLSTAPDNTDYEFDLLTTLNAAPLALSRPTAYEFFGSAEGLAAGDYELSTQVVIQDARYARDLKTAIAHFTAEVARYQALIDAATDPVLIGQYEAAKARNQSLQDASASELAAIRTNVGSPVTHNFIVE